MLFELDGLKSPTMKNIRERIGYKDKLLKFALFKKKEK